jgi:hypothetical protein
VLRDSIRVADNCRATGVLHCALDTGLELEAVDRETRAAGDVAELVRDGLDLDSVERDEGQDALALLLQVLNALDRNLLRLHDDLVQATPKDGAHSHVVLARRGLAEVDDAPVNARE